MSGRKRWALCLCGQNLKCIKSSHCLNIFSPYKILELRNVHIENIGGGGKVQVSGEGGRGWYRGRGEGGGWYRGSGRGLGRAGVSSSMKGCRREGSQIFGVGA